MLKTRLITSMVLMVGFLAAVFFLPPLYWAFLMLLFIVLAAHEWVSMAGFSAIARTAYVSIFALAGGIVALADELGLPALQPMVMFYGIMVATVFWLIASPSWLIARFHVRAKWLLGLVGVIVLYPTWMSLVSLRDISPWLLLLIMATVWIADSAAYFVGKRYGKRKLAPQISPGKTWEGVLGAWAAVTIYGLVLCITLSLSYWTIVGLLGITVLSIMGDLLESLVKRQAGVKDSGTMLPGHGGVLDRIDGLTSSLPLTMFFIYFPTYYLVMESFYV